MNRAKLRVGISRETSCRATASVRAAWFPARTEPNLRISLGSIMAERLFLSLVDRGITRVEAYRTAQRLAVEAKPSGREYTDVVRGDPELIGMLGAEAIAEIADPVRYLGHIDTLIGETLERVGKGAHEWDARS
jgi:adenylosuccinate lyase